MKEKKLFFEKSKSLKVSFFIIILSFFAAFFCSCNNGLMPYENADDQQNEFNSEEQKAYIVFNFSNNSGRAITSNFTPANFSNVAFDGSDGNGHTVHESAASFSELTGKRIYVDVGNWNFVLTADYGSEKYKATKTASIAPGPNSISMKLVADTSSSGGTPYDPAEHPGSYNISVVFPSDSIDLVHFEIKTFAGNVLKYSENKVKGTDYTGNGEKTINFTASSFESGIFLASVAFRHKTGTDSSGNDIYEDINVWDEILTINPGIQATGTINLPKSEPVYNINFELNGGDWDSGSDESILLSYTRAGGDYLANGTRASIITLPTETSVKKDGHHFAGWYDNPSLTGIPVTSFNISDKENKTYYAKWREFVCNLYISCDGVDDDSTRDGSIDHPFKTISYCYSRFEDISATKADGSPQNTIHVLTDYKDLNTFTYGQGTASATPLNVNIVGAKGGTDGNSVIITANLDPDSSFFYIHNGQEVDFSDINFTSTKNLSNTNDYNGFACLNVAVGGVLKLKNSSIKNYYAKSTILSIDGDCYLDNVEIKDNYAVSDPAKYAANDFWGCAVWIAQGTLHLKNQITITGTKTWKTDKTDLTAFYNDVWIGHYDEGTNTHYNNPIDIQGSIAGSQIGVNMNFDGITPPTLSVPVAFTSHYSDHNTADPATIFTATNSYTIIKDTVSGEAMFRGDTDGYVLNWFYASGDSVIPVSAADKTSLGLPSYANIGSDTSFTLDTTDSGIFYDSESGQNVCTKTIKISNQSTGTSVTHTDSASGATYTITNGTITAETNMYILLNIGTVYFNSTGDDDAGGWTKNRPVKTIAAAKSLIKNNTQTSSAIMVMSTIEATDSDTSDVENLSNLTTTTYNNAILKRHSSISVSANLVYIKDNISTTIKNLTIDGGAVFASLASNESIYGKTNEGIQTTGSLVKIADSKTVSLQNIILQNNCNSNNGVQPYALYMGIGVQLSFKDSTITRCSKALYSDVWGTANVNIENCIISYNGTLDPEVVYIHTGSNKTVTFDNVSFINNKQDGTVIRNECPITLKACSFTGNVNASATPQGSNIYTSDSVTLDGACEFADGDIYLATRNKPLILTSGFSLTGSATTVTLKPAAYSRTVSSSTVFDTQVLDFATNSLTAAQITAAKSKFVLADSDYVIDDNGYVKPLPGTVTVTPGFPGNYVCQWRQSVSGSTRTINIIVKDLSGNSITTTSTPVSIVSTSIDIGCYEGGEKIHSASSLSFNLPSWWPDTPSGTPFYVKFNVQVDATTAYSYDYWPEQGWIGTKAPDAAKEVGDIVFNDGSAMAYTDFAAITDTSVINEKKAAAIALIFYKGTSESDVLGARTLGVGLKHNQSGLAWCLSGADAYSKNITTIQCPASGSIGAVTFTGDKDGSNNLEQIEDFSGVDDTTTAANYPAFYFGKNYATNTVTNIEATSEFATGWYLPSIAELSQIYACRADTSNGFDIDAASEALGGNAFGTSSYWSSSQYASDESNAYALNFRIRNLDVYLKRATAVYVCCIRAF
ncbi:MAG: InlB B-repeat-containing protein [Spirochaetales bacterium]|nr:InlB B-repeat-containing protein [Spirochaetales bacterium]